MDISRLLILSLEGEEDAKYLLCRELIRQGYNERLDDANTKTVYINLPFSGDVEVEESANYSIMPSNYVNPYSQDYIRISRSSERRSFVLIKMKRTYLHPELVSARISEIDCEDRWKNKKTTEVLSDSLLSVSVSREGDEVTILVQGKKGFDWLERLTGTITVKVNGR